MMTACPAFSGVLQNIRLRKDSAGGYFFVLDLHDPYASAIGAAAAGVEDPQAIRLLITFCPVGMAIEDRIGAAAAGIGKQSGGTGFHTVLMAVGHKQHHAADGVAEDICRPGVTAVTITVAGNLMEHNGRILLLQCLAVLVMVTQVYHMVRPQLTDAKAHKAEPRVGIG